MTRSALGTASPTSLTSKPAASAFAHDPDSFLRATVTLAPESLRLFA